MKRIWHIALMDLRLMVRDKIFFFWTLLFPLVFILIFGNLYTGEQPQAELIVLNQDSGKWGTFFTEKLNGPGIVLKIVTKEPEQYTRLLVIPEDFSRKIEAQKAQELLFKKFAGANINAAAQIEVKLFQAIAKLITQLALHPDTATFFQQQMPFKDIVQVKSQFPENTVTKIPSGFDHVIPGIMVQFIVMMVFIYGGVSVMIDRKRGTLSRILYSSTSIAQLWGGKFLGRVMMALLQALILIVTGKLFFHLNLGNTFLALLNILVFSIAIASLSIYIGSIVKKEDLIIGISVLLANLFSALGGCWWPLEVVPQTFRTIGMISPSYWAMDTFHSLIFFNKGFADILPNLLVLLAFALVFTIPAIKYFKIKD